MNRRTFDRIMEGLLEIKERIPEFVEKYHSPKKGTGIKEVARKEGEE